MRIEQQDNGNIIIQNNTGQITHVLSSISIQKHPRKNNALIIYSKDFESGYRGIEFLASRPIYINQKSYRVDADKLLKVFAKNIAMNGVKIPEKKPINNPKPPDTKPTPNKKEDDPNYQEFVKANTYEKLLAFAKKHQDNVGGKYYRNGKLVSEDIFCQFDTFIIRVILSYNYKRSNPNLINYIQMTGNVTNVPKSKKVYVYDANNTVTGYVYKGIFDY